MNKKISAWLSLTLITATAGLLLGATNALTSPTIEQQSLAAAEESRSAVFAQANGFRKLELDDTANLGSCYEALLDDTTIGHVATTTVKGYGGEIEITIGLDANNVITGISVGGESFAESPGLGARTRDEAFTSQFVQASAPLTLGQDVDSISGATISSGAVVSGVNRIAKAIENLGKDASEIDPYHNAVDDSYVELPADETIERALRAPDGSFAVYVSAKGFHGDINLLVLTDANGRITRIAIDETTFNETAGLGERVLEEGFLKQFIGLDGVIGVQAGGYGADTAVGTDATSAATATTEGEAAPANEQGADATSAATATTEGEAAPANEQGTDATSAATATTEGEAAPANEHGTDATSAATATTEGEAAPANEQVADGTSSATLVIEEIEGANADIDGVSGATYSSAAVAKAVNAALAFIRSVLGKPA